MSGIYQCGIQGLKFVFVSLQIAGCHLGYTLWKMMYNHEQNNTIRVFLPTDIHFLSVHPTNI